MSTSIDVMGIGTITEEAGLKAFTATTGGDFRTGRDGVESIYATGDGKVEFIAFADRTLARVNSAMGYPAYYPLHPASAERPLKAVLMDLDGTSVHSEDFWIWIIQQTTASLLGDPRFELEAADFPFVSGHSVSEHLKYCLRKYCPDRTVEEARAFYFEHTGREMREILAGRGRVGAFAPAPGLKEFLLELKGMGIRIGLVTSGLYEKAWPEILAAFRSLGMGDPAEFYDAIVSAGYPLRRGTVGTLGELEAKPHPWLYSETGRIGLGIDFKDRNSVLGIEDSGAGICAVRLAGYPAVGIAGGNIWESGTQALCQAYCRDFTEILRFIKEDR